MLKISKETGIWSGINSMDMMLHHVHDSSLANAICNFFTRENAKTVGDFGCGTGFYTKQLLKSAIHSYAYDGNPNTFEISGGIGSVLDLSNIFRFPEPFDWVLSLEVGEHIPAQFESTYISNLHENNKHGVVLSWAVEGQKGDGHVNCQNNEYIKYKFDQLGYSSDITSEQKMRESSTAPWFKDTIMVFRKN
jgi:cyclopropane fatty-acyl-phospholipid synthase-like methyltransferase